MYRKKVKYLELKWKYQEMIQLKFISPYAGNKTKTSIL